jgi:hypothetical protein
MDERSDIVTKEQDITNESGYNGGNSELVLAVVA